MSLIILVAADAAFEQRVGRLLSQRNGDVAQLWEGPLASAADVKTLAERAPAAVILGPRLGKDNAFSLAAYFDRQYPAISVLVVAPPGPETWQRALATGTRALISPTGSDDELRAGLERALKPSRPHPNAAAGNGGPAAGTKASARVITVVSPKGGSGKTIVATNLAVGLAARSPGNAVLLDLDLQFGDTAYALGMSPQHTIADAVSVLEDLDVTTLKVFLTRHKSGLYVLCAPDEPASGDGISAAAVTNILRLLSSQFGYVVIDTSAGLDEYTLAALDLSTDIVLLTDMDVPSVRNLRKAVDVLDMLGMRKPIRHMVLNRSDSRVGLTKSGIAAAAGTAIDFEVPSSRYVPVSLNEGHPLLLDNPRSPVARSLARLVERIANGPGGSAPGARGEKP